MKIKLSKSQWEMVGSKAGWMNKKAQMDNEEVMHIQGLVQRLKDLKKEYFGESSALEDNKETIIEGDAQSELEGLIITLERSLKRENDASFRERAGEGDSTSIAFGEQ